jgi:hypothetical protein
MKKTRVDINRTAMARARARILTGKIKLRIAIARARARILTGKIKLRIAIARARARILTGKIKLRIAIARARARILTDKIKLRIAIARARTITTLGKGLEVSNTRVITTTLTRTISTMPTKTMVKPRIRMRCCRNAPRIRIRTKTTNSRRPTAFRSPRLRLHLRQHSRPMRTLTSTKSNSAGSESGKSKKNSIISVLTGSRKWP